MSGPLSKVDAATEADWSFTEDAKAMRAVEKAAWKATDRFEHVEFDDALQDAYLWLAVRPAMVTLARESGNYGQLAQDIYSNALAKPASRESKRANRLVPWDQLGE